MIEHASTRMTYAEYLALEAASEQKHAFLDGDVWAMAGGTPRHSAVCANIIGLLRDALKGRPCQVFTSDLRVRTLENDLHTTHATYPDATVVCGKLETHPDDPHVAVNPLVIVEVTSPSTQKDDRGAKYEIYRRIASLRAYVVANADRKTLTVYTRNDDGSWLLRDHADGTAPIAPLDVALSIAEVFADPLAS